MSVFLSTDVTAVKIFKNLIIAGIGSYANIFNKSTNEFIKRVQCLNGQKIYGFIPSEGGDEVLVFGGKQFTILTIEEDNDRLSFKRVFEPVTCDDWLHSAVWIDEERFSLLTAHNVVQKWTKSPTPALISKLSSSDNFILYSGLLVPLQDDTLVLAGTVYSEVIVHCSGHVLHRLIGHKGVIFSISCDITNAIIVTTSDDRSVRIWGPPKDPPNPNPNTSGFWSKTKSILCRHELYGHNARVMRNCIINDIVISVGEDSAICFWDYSGKLLKKLISHQNGGIWSVDSDNNEVVTGGSDGAVIVHPLTVITHYQKATVQINQPRKVFFTAKNNLLVLSENNLLYHYNIERRIETRHRLNENSSYKCIGLSSCKQMVAVCDMHGKLDVFIENCRNTALLTRIIDERLNFNNILSMHWAGNKYLVFCSYDGHIRVLSTTTPLIIELVAAFNLPLCKERWLTAAAYFDIMFVLGDRCGNLHIFVVGNSKPVKTFEKIHGRYGPTSIRIKNNEIITTGRDGSVKIFSIKGLTVEFMFTRDVGFQWVDKFLDKDETVVCGFHERDFIVYDLRNNAKICEVPCGGGHRSWDAMRYIESFDNKFEGLIKFAYIKNNDIHIEKFVLSRIVSKNLINGTHGKAINCLQTFKVDSTVAFVTGSEDTTLRVSLFNTNKLEGNVISKHLSNVKTVKIYNLDSNRILTVSGGGRAQICAAIINLQENEDDMMLKSKLLTNYMMKGIDKNRKNNQDWRNSTIDFDPETRIMDLEIVKTDDTFKIYTGCSDGILRIFELNNLENPKFQAITHIDYHKTCILKIKHIEYLNQNIIITCSTRGEIAFWNTDLGKDPIFNTTTNKSGINSIATEICNEKLIMATGGDDNAIHLLAIVQTNKHPCSFTVLSTFIIDSTHSSQISGLLLVDKYLISTSIDQRVTLIGWNFDKMLDCVFLDQIFSDVADVQGMELIEYTSSSITVCVFGNGLEVIKLKLPDE